MNGHGHGYRGRPRGADLMPPGEETPWDMMQRYYRNAELQEPYPEPMIFDRPDLVREHGGAPMQPAESPRFREGQREHPEWDALRWGDADAVTGTTVATVPFTATSKQLARAHVPRPVVWLVQLNVDQGVQFPAGEAVANIAVFFNITIGCGQSRTAISAVILLPNTNAYQPPLGVIPAPFSVPAQDIQVNAEIAYTPTASGLLVVPVGAMVAPWAHVPFGESAERFATSSLQRRR